ncbi:glycosyltransferase family 39 protein [Paenibacillus sp. GCM10023252]|uniref:glycosyltransferase family 39 protein n=1 Tax=Paenibacillus sp. GCM10023252 TaxID=3252649 RepID=UPI00361C9780
MNGIRRIDGWLVLIMGLALILNIYNIGEQDLGNTYYAAAVKSMLQSWHNFFYASYDPAGFITVDKPPVAMWVQTISASLFGYHGWSLILPQVLAGVLSVGILYAIMKPSFGAGSARIAALVLAVTPITVAVSRTNNVDSILVFTLLLAAWALFKSIRLGGRIGWLIAAVVLVGIGFNIKMLQAYMVLPAFYLMYVIGVRVPWRRRIAQLTAATAVLLLVSVSWAVIVDSIPEDKRPYIGSSQTNSVLELAFGYNGVSRLTGEGGPGQMMGGGGGEMPAMPGGGEMPAMPDGGEMPAMPSGGQMPAMPGGGEMPAMPGGGEMPAMPGGGEMPAMPGGGEMPAIPGGGQMPAMPGGGEMPDLDPEQMEKIREQMEKMGIKMPANGEMPAGGMGPMSTGEAGALRMFSPELSGQASWLLVFVLLASLALFAGAVKRRSLTAEQNEALFWYVWLLPMLVFFSIASFFHEYYLTMLAPAIAALTAIGWKQLWKHYMEETGWQRRLLPAVILLTFLSQALFLNQSSLHSGWAVAAAIAGVVVCGILLWLREGQGQGRSRATHYTAVVGAAALLIAPLYWSMTPALYGDNSILPKAGPLLSAAGGMTDMLSQEADPKLVDYLESNYNGEKFLVATASNMSATPIQLATDKAVMMYGGYLGSDPVLTAEELQEMVDAGEVRYFYTTPMGSSQTEVSEWIAKNTKEVPASEWQSESNGASGGMPMMGGMSKLYEVIK